MAQQSFSSTKAGSLLRLSGIIVITLAIAALFETWMSGSYLLVLNGGMELRDDLSVLDSHSKTLLNQLAFKLTNMNDKAKAAQSILETMVRQTFELRSQEKLVKELNARIVEDVLQREEKEKQIAELKDEIFLVTERTQNPILGYGVLSKPFPRSWKQRLFTHHGPFGLVKFSTYRLEENKFVTMALAHLKHQKDRDLQACLWVDNNGTNIWGKLAIMYHEEHHWAMYEVVVIYCTLEVNTGAEGGHLVGYIDTEEVLLFNEDKMGSLKINITSKLSVCGPPLFGRLEPRPVWEWLEYNRVALGVDKFFFYDIGCLDPPVISTLSKYIESGMLDITYVKTMPYDVWWKAQGLFMHDCLYRNRLTSRWVMYHDLDEYPAPAHPLTMQSILTKFADSPWITHQVTWWCLSKCNTKKGDELWGVERTVFRWPHVYCQDRKKYNINFCLTDKGHRKLIVNPFKTWLLGIHYVKGPEEGGIHLHVLKEMTHHHFQGLNTRGRRYGNKTFCQEEFADNVTMEWWWRDYSFANLMPEYRACAFGNQTCVHQLD